VLPLCCTLVQQQSVAVANGVMEFRVSIAVLQRVATCCKCCNVLQCATQFVAREIMCSGNCVTEFGICVATCCNVLQRVATCCNVLQRVATCCNVLQRVAVCCNLLQQQSNAAAIVSGSVFNFDQHKATLCGTNSKSSCHVCVCACVLVRTCTYTYVHMCV